MQVTIQEIEDLKNFVTLLNIQQNSIVVVEGKKDSKALRSIGFVGIIIEFHKLGGFINFVDFVANFENVIILFDNDRKGRQLTAKAVYHLQRRTNVNLSFKYKLVQITKGKIQFIEQLARYESYLE